MGEQEMKPLVLGVDMARGADMSAAVIRRGERIIAMETDPQKIERMIAWYRLKTWLDA